MSPIKAVFCASLIGFAAFPHDAVYGQSLGLPTASRMDACRIHYTAPAIVETVTKQVLIKPETLGTDPQTGQTIVVAPAVYRTETEQKIIRARQQDWADIICRQDQSVVFIQSLQRALAARGHYNAVATGVMDERTKRALRKVQKKAGINTAEVTMDLAESYGLITHRIFTK
ncbi:MAG: peptidoglycan-binding protein [Proteobacteria bacterium]|nr:peptidoglycan-binding protein [Pseudomonadota bacterium]